MDSLNLLAILLRIAFQGLRLIGASPTGNVPEPEAAGLAWGLAYAVLATFWQHRHRNLNWPRVYVEWQRATPEAAIIDPRLYGRFDADDNFQLLTVNSIAFETRFQLYLAAQSSIDISTYYMQADELGWRTAHALADCVLRGVRVRVLADRLVTQRKTFENPKMNELTQFLKNAGVDFRLFLDPQRPYDANHRKLLIVDRKKLVTGGRNYADHYAGREWRDLDLLLAGPSVTQANQCFEDTFNMKSYSGGGRFSSNIFQADTPTHIASNVAFTYLLQCIRFCRQTLDIEHAYFFNHPVFHSELQDACQRGVRVRLFTNSAESNDLAFTNYRLYLGLGELFDAGVSIYLRKGAGLTLHCKYFVADGEWVGFGSTNLDYYSPRFCHELAILARDQKLGAALFEWFEEGIAEADHLTRRDCTNISGSWLKIGRIFDRWCPDIQ